VNEIQLASAPPTQEIGYERQPRAPIGRPPNLTTDLGWNQFVDDVEYVPELKWPRSVKSYQRMRTDSQLSGLFRAMTMPIRRFHWLIDPNGADPAIVDHVANDLNLDVKGQEPRPHGRMKGRFSWDSHLYEGLLALMFGHAYFEQWGQVEADGLFHLKKLAPRPQDSIQEINVADDGGLISIRQGFVNNRSTGVLGYSTVQGVEIPVDRLVAYIWEQEAANWVGRSLFRDCYRNWLVKDRLLRVDAINHERAGGVPIVEGQPGASNTELARMSQLAQEFKVGEAAGGALPAGAKLNLHKVGGGTDVIGSIRYHDESMARMFLHMFIQLGQTETGSRALGEAFIEYAFLAQKAVAKWFADVTNEHVIEDLVDWNFGENVDTVPLLTWEIQEEDEHIAIEELVKLIQVKAVIVDEELEDMLRERYHLTKRTAPRPGIVVPENIPPDTPPPPTNQATEGVQGSATNRKLAV
jgi:hypothetical protein